MNESLGRALKGHLDCDLVLGAQGLAESWGMEDTWGHDSPFSFKGEGDVCQS